MRKLLITTSLLFATATSFAIDKVGMINTSILFKEHPIFRLTEQDLKKKISQYQKELQEDRETIEQKQKELNRKKATKRISAANAKKEQKIIDDIKVLLDEKAKMFNEEKTQLENSSRQKILVDIQKNASEYAEINDYTMIIDSGSVVHISKQEDLTEAVLKHIKSKKY